MDTGLCGPKLCLLWSDAAESRMDWLAIVVGFDVGEQVASVSAPVSVADVPDSAGLADDLQAAWNAPTVTLELQHGIPGDGRPHEGALGRPAPHPIRELEDVGVKVPHHAVDAAPPLEDLEDELKAVARPLVGILDDLPRGPADEAARHRKAEVPALGLIPMPVRDRT